MARLPPSARGDASAATQAGPVPADPVSAVELPSRLVFSLLQGAARLAARVHMPLGRLTDLLRTAYFHELRRRHPRDLAAIADKLGVSLRTAGTLNRALREPFYAPENRVEPVREVIAALQLGVRTPAELAARLDLEPAEVRRILTHLVEVGWASVDGEGRAALITEFRNHVADDLERRVDGVNHQMDVVARSVWARFVSERADAAGRTWSFTARPEDVEAAAGRVLAALRAEAIALEEAAMAAGGGRRYGLTVALAPELPLAELPTGGDPARSDEPDAAAPAAVSTSPQRPAAPSEEAP